MTKKTIIRYRDDYDRMSIDAKFPTGGVFKFSVTRNGERLVLGGSNDPTIAKQQQAVVAAWVNYRKDETNGQRHERIKAMLASCNSVGQLVTKINDEAKQPQPKPPIVRRSTRRKGESTVAWLRRCDPSKRK